MKLSKKRLFWLFSSIFFIAIFSLIACYLKSDRLAFHRYVKDFSALQLETNALDLHYTLSNPDAYHLQILSPLPLYKKEEAKNSYQQVTTQLKELEKIDISSLSNDDAFTYQVLHDYLTETMVLEQYPYYQEPLTTHSGIHTTLPILLAEYSFSSKEDIETYLEILAFVPDYLRSILVYEKEKADVGFFMTEKALNEVTSTCIQFATYDNISEHLLCASFTDKLANLSISAEEKMSYSEKNANFVKETILPAYLSMAEELAKLLPYCDNDFSGLCTYQNGKEYYLALLRRNTGCYRDIQNIKEMLFADFERSYASLSSLIAPNPYLLEEDCFYDFDTSFPLTDANEILNQLSFAMKKDFPTLSVTPNYTIKTVTKSLEQSSAPAFYLTVPMDNYMENVIYLNPANTLSGISLYTTLAHEGFPGHLYQTVFFHTQNHSSTNYNALLRNTLYYGGYTEGYAMYVESLSYDYASTLCCDAGVKNAQIICKTLKEEWKMQMSLYCLLDIAMHYDGATREQITSLLNQFGIQDEENIQTIYEYLLSEPTAYLKYYLGYLEIENLKTLAQNLWGENYSNQNFHDFLLKAGPCNFRLLENKLVNEE